MSQLVGGLACGLGITAIAGWHLGLGLRVESNPHLAPVPSSTALAFVCIGLGIIATTFMRSTIARACGSIAGLMGLATLLQYAIGVDPATLAWAPPRLDATAIPHAGRIAPNTALGLVFAGAALLLTPQAPRRSGTPLRAFATSLLGSSTASVGAVACAGHLTGIEMAYRWGHAAPMVLQTALGFVIVGVCLQFRGTYMILPGGGGWASQARTPISVGLIAGGVFLWQAQYTTESRFLEAETAARLGQVSQALRNELSLRFAALSRVARRWEVARGTPEAEWRADSRHYLRDDSSYRAIEWIDSSYRIRWIEPLEGNEAALGLDLGAEAWRREPLDRARDRRETTMTRVFELVQNGRAFVAYEPIFVGERFDGFIAGLIDPRVMLDHAFGPMGSEHHIEVRDQDRIVYSSGSRANVGQAHLGHQRELEVLDRQWTLRIWPTDTLVAATRTALPWALLALMGTMAVFVPLCLSLLVRSRLETKTLNTVLSNNPSGILISDEQGRIEFANRSLHTLLRHEFPTLIGQSVESLLPSSSSLAHAQMRAQFWISPSPRLMQPDRRVDALCKDGRVVPVEIALTMVRTPKGMRALATVLDARSRVHAESLAQRRTEELERSNQDLEQFAYVASHDLQEPLRMVISYTELLARRYSDRLDDAGKRFIQHACDGARRMQRLIADLLQLSRVHHSAHRDQVVDTAHVLDEVIDEMQDRIREVGANLQASELPMVHADPVQLGQVFRNLIGNALKFVGEESPSVRISTSSAAGGFVQFCIADNGIGFSPENAERIFSMCQRLHTRDRYEGSGIGLAIVKKVVEQHGGAAWAESRVGQGARFYFTLRLASRKLSDEDHPDTGATPAEEGG